MKKYLYPVTLLACISVVFGTIYGVAQQSIRQAANDPQIQIAEDTAEKLNNGATLTDNIGTAVDPYKSLATFVEIYNKNGVLAATSASTVPSLPAIPIGVLLASTHKTFNVVTWQPAPNLRLASITVAAHDYYVTVARSLTEVENREVDAMQITFLGWVLVVSILGTYYFIRKNNLFK